MKGFKWAATVLIVVITGCSDPSEEEKVSNILKRLNDYSQSADNQYNSALQHMESIKSQGLNINLIEEISYNAEGVNSWSAAMARLYIDDSEEIENEQAKTHLKAGIEHLHGAYKSKYEFLNDTAVALKTGEISIMQAAITKHAKPMQQVESKVLMAMLEFSAAKSVFGSTELPEFKD